MCGKFVNLPLRLVVWFGLVGLLAAGSMLACDSGTTTVTTERPADRPAPTSKPEEPPTSAPTPTPSSTAAPTLAPEPVATSTATTSESTPPPELVIRVSSVLGDIPAYDRDDWRHWIDEDGDCQNARHEVLIEESQAAVTYRNDRECQVDTGQWFGTFTATTVTEASKLDVDHLVPLANAHQSGGWAWTPERKEQYANNLE